MAVSDDGIILFANEPAGALFQAHEEALVATLLSDHLECDALSEMLRADDPHELAPVGCPLRDDPSRTIAVRASPIVIDEVQAVLLALEDITTRRAAARYRKRLAAVVESSKDAIISKDLDGTIESWNDAATQLFGYPESEAIGSSIRMLFPEDRLHEEDEIIQTLREGERVPHFETVRLHKDGTPIDVEVTISPLFDAEGKVVGASKIVRDIRSRKQRDDELRRSNAELEQFAYVASHDLQEPLRMVASYTELLGERYRGQLDERADRYIHFASDGARRMQALINDLLAFSRIGTQGKALEDVEAQEVVKYVLLTLRNRAKEAGAELEIGDLPHVLADEGQLGQLFQNLLTNAIKFRSDERPCKVSVSAEREGPHWHFRVEDNGIGLDPQFGERIFEMFQRLHSVGAYDGSGIGLALCKRIVERHGGRIWVESTPGEGSTFHFTLRSVPS